jgi:hypothetical protein
MKRTIMLSVLMLAIFATTMNAQRYSDLKLKYDYHQYTPQIGDPYNPTVSGLCSFLIPGLGQVVSGETGRGIAFFGGYVGCGILYSVGAAQLANSLYSGSTSGSGTMLLGFAGMIAVDIWSIVDANHVAKVKNMYLRDTKKTSGLNLEVAPYVAQYNINNQIVTPVGMTMRVKF